VHNTELYAAGDFLTACGGAAKYVARWTGSSWAALGGGLNYIAFALASFNGSLYVGGQFSAPGVSVARWNGSAWSALVNGLDGPVTSMDVYNNSLIIGGSFTTSGGFGTYSHIARWNGTSFGTLGSGTAQDVFAVKATGACLFAGGAFVTAGGKASRHIGQWQDVVVGVGDAPFALALDSPVPSPSRGRMTLSFRLPESSPVRLDLVDVRGRLMATLVNGTLSAGPHQATWNGRDASGSPVASGVYFARLFDGHSARVQRLVRLAN